MGKQAVVILTIFAIMLSLNPVFVQGDGGGQFIAPEPSPPQVDTITTCLDRVNIPEEELHWIYVPFSASELRTEVSYLFLAGQLIRSGAVDASSCPSGGLGAGDYANACGMALTRSVVIELQNAYDDAIMTAWRDIGVPPVLLKQLIRYESQFWPAQHGAFHFGLGHLTFLGAHSALMWNFSLFREVCTVAYNGGCSQVDNTMVYTLLGMMNADCPTCEYKIDIPKAQRSVHYLGEAVFGFCRQASQIVYNATEKHSSKVVNYATIWKLTLMNYNAGATCAYNAVDRAYKEEVKRAANPNDIEKLDWEDIENNTTGDRCLRGIDYANQITAEFYDFPPD